MLAPLFWNAPEVHLRGLEKIYIDGIIAIVPWGGFIGKLQNEWQEFVLYVRPARTSSPQLFADSLACARRRCC